MGPGFESPRAYQISEERKIGFSTVLRFFIDSPIPTDIENIKQEMVDDGYRARTINIMITAVKRLYNWAVKQELLEENPLDGVERVSEHVNALDRPEDKHLSWEEARESIETCGQSPPLGRMCKLMLLTGMRVGEVVRLAWADIGGVHA